MFNFQNRRVLVTHLFFWSLLMTPKFPFLRGLDFSPEVLWGMALSFFLLFSISLINALVLVPRFFKVGSFGWYAPVILVLAVSAALLMRLIIQQVVPFDLNASVFPQFFWAIDQAERPLRLMTMAISSLPVLVILFVSLVHQVAAFYMTKERQDHQFREAQLQSELKLLRTQINPHFLFNTLNNLYALVQTRPALVEDLLLRFGDILRFVTYESHQEQIELSREVAYIENYIHLQRVKDEEFDNVRLTSTGDLNGFWLEPMLLIPFVENAFKHSYREESAERWIHIHLEVKADGLYVRVENNLPVAEEPPDQPGGIGLDNVRQRLRLRYPHAHSLETHRLSDRYHVSLWLNPLQSESSS